MFVALLITCVRDYIIAPDPYVPRHLANAVDDLSKVVEFIMHIPQCRAVSNSC